MTSRSLPLSDDAASARSRAAVTGVGQTGGDERPVEAGCPHRLRRRARHDDERGLADLAGTVAGRVVPAFRPVDHVEEVAAEDDGARGGGRLAQDPAVVGVAGKRPCVQGLAAGAQTVVRTGARPGDEAVEGDRDVSDDSSHARADPIHRPNSSLTHEACGGSQLGSTTHEAARQT